MAIEFRLCDEDREKFAPEGAPEWVAFDQEELNVTPFDVQHPWEREIRRQHIEMSIVSLVALEFPAFSSLGIKAMVWLAWKMAGIETPPWKDFNILTLLVERRALSTAPESEEESGDGEEEQGDDADPPAGGSTDPSSAMLES